MKTSKISIRYFFLELRRFLLSPIYLIVFLICMISFYNEMHDFGYFNGHSNYLNMSVELLAWPFVCKLLPLLVSVYVIKCMIEKQSGYGDLIAMKMSRKKYNGLKLVINFVVSGLAFAIPYAITELYLIISWKSSIKELVLSELEAYSQYNVYFNSLESIHSFLDLAENRPNVYILLCVTNAFLCSAVIGTLALGLSKIIKNKVIVYISVFAIYVVTGMFSTDLFVGASLNNNLGMFFDDRNVDSYYVILLGYLFYFMIGTVIYIYGESWKERWGNR